MRRCAPQKRGSNARPGIRCAHRGVATTEPTSKRRLWISTKRWASTGSISPSVSRAMPTAAFNSSVSPSAQNTAPSLGPRAPLKSIEVPRSPVRVYTDTRRVCSLAGGTGEGSEQEFFYRQAHARAPCRGGAGTHEVAIAPWIWPLAAAGIEWQESGSATCLQFRWALAARHKVLDSMRRGGPQECQHANFARRISAFHVRLSGLLGAARRNSTRWAREGSRWCRGTAAAAADGDNPRRPLSRAGAAKSLCFRRYPEREGLDRVRGPPRQRRGRLRACRFSRGNRTAACKPARCGWACGREPLPQPYPGWLLLTDWPQIHSRWARCGLPGTPWSGSIGGGLRAHCHAPWVSWVPVTGTWTSTLPTHRMMAASLAAARR